jgi:hypothetical protein
MEAPDDRPVAARTERAPESGGTPTGKLGITVEPTGAQVASESGARANGVRGVVVKDIDPSGPARGRLFQEDIITAVIGRGGAQRPITTGAQLKEAVDNATNGVVSLLVYNPQSGNAGGTRVVNVPLNE